VKTKIMFWKEQKVLICSDMGNSYSAKKVNNLDFFDVFLPF